MSNMLAEIVDRERAADAASRLCDEDIVGIQRLYGMARKVAEPVVDGGEAGGGSSDAGDGVGSTAIVRAVAKTAQKFVAPEAAFAAHS